MVIFLFVLAVFGQATAKWNYTVTVKTAAIESPGSELNLTVTMQGKGGNSITHVLRRQGAEVQLARRQARVPVTASNAWRDDGRCGSSYPNAAGEDGECNPDDPDGYTCCSPYGWCGSSFAHCDCDSCVNYANSAVVGATVTWCEYQDSYLYTYSNGRSSYSDLASAQAACLERNDCGGITQEPYNNNRYTLRVGPELYEGASPTDEISWVTCEADGSTEANIEVQAGNHSTARECEWSSAESNVALDGTKLRQLTTKSYSNPEWMNGNTFTENVALCQRECESRDDCAGLNFSPTFWDHQECFLMSGNDTYSRSGWSMSRASCQVQEAGNGNQGGRTEQVNTTNIDLEEPVVVDTVGEDGFSSGSLDVFSFDDDIDLGTLLYVNISSGSDNAWQLDWLSCMTDRHFDEHKTRYVYNTETKWLSTDSADDNNTAVDLLQLEVQGTETYYFVIETANKTDSGSDSIHLKAIIHGSHPRLTYTGYLDNPGEDDFVGGENDVFIVPGLRPAGRLECITLLCWGDDEWEFDWIVVFSIKSYSQPPRVFMNNGTVLSTDISEGVKEYYVCRNDNQYGSD